MIHGNLYEVDGKISMNTQLLTFTTKVVPWEDRLIRIGANIKDIHYLFVSEYNIKMPNINSYTFNYASDLSVTYEITSVKYTGYNADGDKVPGTYTLGSPYYPTVNINSATHKITVSFGATPKNYVPTYITLKIKTTDGSMEEIVNVIHYPTPYVEAVWNDLHHGGIPDSWYEGTSNKDNHNLFTITSIATGNFKIGDSRDTDKTTKTDVDANNLVSPKFVIASQHGVASEKTYANAKNRCKNYVEGPYQTAGTWRIPTKAEIEFINSLQDDGNSAVKGLLEGSKYWSAYMYHYYNFNDNKFTSGNSSSTSFIRCVHDVY